MFAAAGKIFLAACVFYMEVCLMKRWLRRLIVPLVLIALVCAALNNRPVICRYTVESEKVEMPIRLATLTDLHGCDLGMDIAALVAVQQPDAILLVGDMFSADGETADELALFRQLAELAPVFYVTGNHEYWEQDVPTLLDQIRATGVSVLDQTCVQFRVGEQIINICGIPDPAAGAATEQALQNAASGLTEGYTILLAHRPEMIEQYAAAGCFDLVLSGHAHGGQVRIPGLVNGLCAPNQGWFPKYAGGEYQVEDTTMIVSRGLSTQAQWYVPRIFNPPEIVIVTIE